VNRCTVLILTAAMGGGCALAQTGNPLIAESKQSYTSIKNNLTKAADKMSEADYSFKATPDVRTFAGLIGHIADVQMRMCAGVKGEQKAATASSMTAKADLVAALKASFDECDAAFDSLTDANAMERVAMGRGPGRTKLGTLLNAIIHDNEEYGYLAVYMRLKGIVPPSSEGR
jgi:uncharacterized damage-inducible protein DinB